MPYHSAKQQRWAHWAASEGKVPSSYVEHGDAAMRAQKRHPRKGYNRFGVHKGLVNGVRQVGVLARKHPKIAAATAAGTAVGTAGAGAYMIKKPVEKSLVQIAHETGVSKVKDETLAGAFGWPYSAIQGKKGKKLRATGRSYAQGAGGALAGEAAGGGVGAGIGAGIGALTRRPGAARLGALIGGVGGASAGVTTGAYQGNKAAYRSNKRKGYLKGS